MHSNLIFLLAFTVKALTDASIPYWLDYGTLLGATRDHQKGLIPWEFDVDLGVMEEDCDRIYGLKPKLLEFGFTVYDRKDWIPQKRNRLLGYSGYISTPCIRIYDSTSTYSLDIYWYQRVDPTLHKSLSKVTPPGIHPPPEYDAQTDGLLICNEEGFTGELPGGCRLEKDVFPTQTISFVGTSMHVPAKPEKICELMYGADWHIPQPKGYKALVCPWLPSSTFVGATMVLYIAMMSGVARRKMQAHCST